MRSNSAPRPSGALSRGSIEDSDPGRDDVPRPRRRRGRARARARADAVQPRRHEPGLFPEAEQLRATARGPLGAGRAHVGRRDRPVRLRAGGGARVGRAPARLRRYIFVSSVSVYADFSANPVQPDGEVGSMPVDEVASDYSNYGPLKALAEAEAERVFGDRALIVRPGLIVGRTTRPAASPTGRAWSAAARSSRRARPSGACSSSTSGSRRGSSTPPNGPSGTFNATNEGAPGRAARGRRRDLGRTRSCRNAASAVDGAAALAPRP